MVGTVEGAIRRGVSLRVFIELSSNEDGLFWDAAISGGVEGVPIATTELASCNDQPGCRCVGGDPNGATRKVLGKDLVKR